MLEVVRALRARRRAIVRSQSIEMRISCDERTARRAVPTQGPQ